MRLFFRILLRTFLLVCRIIQPLCHGFLLRCTCLWVEFIYALPLCNLFKLGFNAWVSATIVEDAHEEKRGEAKDHPLSQWFAKFSDGDELLKLAAARQQVSVAYLLFSFGHLTFPFAHLCSDHFQFWKL